ncbi:MAG TPA: hypothetical protein VK171_04430 [Fimbriimonas sp.]|nr:hypothetical protein [Fimbriimonas sp.]
MDQEALIQETNSLLKQLLELEENRRRESEAAMEELKTKFPTPSFELQESSVPKTDEILSSHTEKFDKLRKLDEEYKQEVLKEYKEQTRLLSEILERLKS